MHRPFNLIEQFLNIVIAESGRQAELSGSDNEGFFRWIICSNQPQPQKPVYHFFERCARAPAFLFKQAGNIVVERKSSSHIMMLHYRHHDVNNEMRLQHIASFDIC